MKTAELTFEVKGGKMHVTDPCYYSGGRGVETLPAKNGTWVAYAEREDVGFGWGARVARLYAFHIDAERLPPTGRVGALIGVDSGQAGFFDFNRFPFGVRGESDDPSTFYGRACAATQQPDMLGIVDGMGVVSSSGYGDGAYDLYAREIDGVNVAFMLDFFGSDDDDEDGDPDDDDSQSESDEDEIADS